MRAVQHHAGADLFEAPGPSDRGEAVAHAVGVERQAGAVEGGDGQRGVPFLVLAGKRDRIA